MYDEGWIDWWRIHFKAQYWLPMLLFWSLLLLFGWKAPRPIPLLLLVTVGAVDILLVDGVLDKGREELVEPIDRVYLSSPMTDYLRKETRDGSRAYDAGDLFGEGYPVATAYGVPGVLGYNPLDVARYRQFLAWIANEAETLLAFGSEYTHPVIVRLDIQNRKLFDLLGVKYVVADWTDETWAPQNFRKVPDPQLESPTASYSFLGAGLNRFSRKRHHLFANQTVRPRAFVVDHVIRQDTPEAGMLAQLKAIDLANTATLEDWDPATSPLPRNVNGGGGGPAKILSHKPNEILIGLDGHTAGLLVLTDPWYPGWVCRVDGQEVPIWKADYAFRGVMVPEGSQDVVFHFEPQSYRRGKWISLTTLAGVAVLFTLSALRRSRRSRI
jgi:hypothetical protein